jgi:hypothetical protein
VRGISMDKKNLVRFAHNWNGGMVEYWNNGMAPFRQNLALLRSAIGSLHQITNDNIRNYKQKNKGSHGLHQGSLRLQTMTALIKSFCGGSRGAVFSKRAPLAAGGKNG